MQKDIEMHAMNAARRRRKLISREHWVPEDLSHDTLRDLCWKKIETLKRLHRHDFLKLQSRRAARRDAPHGATQRVV